MSLKKLIIKGLSYAQTKSGAYALILTEEEGKRTLPVVIGEFEAQSIAVVLENRNLHSRPLTHDLFKSFADEFSINIKYIVIHKLNEGIFFSNIVCQQYGVEKVIDSRTSDAIALSIRFKVPIYATESVLDEAGIYITDDDIDNDFDESLNELEENKYTHLSLNDLNKELNEAVLNENYELAAQIRDEINKRH